jgi:anhydro-N-acetylmuramic acid kinase
LTLTPWDLARNYAQKPERLIVGLMSGTSVNSVDAALVRLSGSGRETRVEFVAFHEHPFPPPLRDQVLALAHGKGNAETVSRAGFRLGHLFADAVGALLASSDTPSAALDLIASHGQTISHTAPEATLQIGEASVLASRFVAPVVSDFRTADMAAGGQGAPLVPYADWCLLTHRQRSRAVQNIGGIGNVTFLPADAERHQVIGFDTGPGNMLIDHATLWATEGRQEFDRDGLLSQAGRVCESLLDFLMGHAFLRQAPPKSAGREEFGESYWIDALRLVRRLDCSPEDVVATMTAFTARTIAEAYRRFLPGLPDELIVGGGGARNPALMRLLREQFSTIPVLAHEDVGINSDAKEAVAFAILANETMLGRPSNLPSVTGALRPAILGKLTLP